MLGAVFSITGDIIGAVESFIVGADAGGAGLERPVMIPSKSADLALGNFVFLEDWQPPKKIMMETRNIGWLSLAFCSLFGFGYLGWRLDGQFGHRKC